MSRECSTNRIDVLLAHTLVMNLTIWLEVVTAALLLAAVAWRMFRVSRST